MNVIITGASRGIGRELVKKFASQAGNKVFAISRNKEKLEALGNDCKNEQPYAQVFPLPIDLTQKAEITEAIGFINENTDSVDVLINNAGQLVNKPFSEINEEEITNIYQVNVLGPIHLIQTALPLLEQPKMSHVINISSMGGFQGSVKFPGLATYASSKAAIASLTECLAEEYKETGIKFNCLAIGAVDTEMLQEAFPGYNPPVTAREMAEYIYDFAINGHKMFNGKVLPVSKTTP